MRHAKNSSFIQSGSVSGQKQKKKKKKQICVWAFLIGSSVLFASHKSVTKRNDIIVVNRNIAYTERVGCTQAQKIIAYKSRQCEMN